MCMANYLVYLVIRLEHELIASLIVEQEVSFKDEWGMRLGEGA